MTARLAFLIGSGVSCAAGLPGTGPITASVLRPRQRCFPLWESATTASSFLDLLAKEQERLLRRLRSTRSVNYEDLYYLAAQVSDSEVGEFENAAVESLVRGLVRKLTANEAVFRPHDEEPFKNEKGYWRRRVVRLADQSTLWIKRTVQAELSKGASSPRALQALVDAGHREDFAVDVFTLNHDTLLETLWRDSGVRFEGGFRPVAHVNNACYLAEYPEVTVWDARAYEARDQQKPCFFKLHGSLDWWSIPHPDVDFLPPAKVDGDPFHIPSRNPRHGRGNYLLPAEPEPVILVGTFNKMLAQARGDSFLDLLCLLRRRLADTTRLMVSGYGFGDKGINGILIEWLSHPGNRMLWIDPDHEQTLSWGRPAAEALRRAAQRQQLDGWRCGFEETSFEDISAWAKAGRST